jgi:hypothetical protein
VRAASGYQESFELKKRYSSDGLYPFFVSPLLLARPPKRLLQQEIGVARNDSPILDFVLA